MPCTGEAHPQAVPYRTALNAFSVYREYATGPPDHDPDTNTSVDDLLVNGDVRERDATLQTPEDNPYIPYPNQSSYLLGDWFWSNGNLKPRADLTRLVGTLQDPGFVNSDLLKTNWDKADAQLGDSGPDNIFKASDGWRRASATIKVPIGAGLNPKDFVVDGLLFRLIEEVIDVRFTKPRASRLHMMPYTEYYCLPDEPDAAPEYVYGEAYSSLEFDSMHATLRDCPPADCTLPRAAAACMLWSDSTHLAEFGTALLWPVYLMFANELKYECVKQSSQACHHIAYIPKVCHILFNKP